MSAKNYYINKQNMKIVDKCIELQEKIGNIALIDLDILNNKWYIIRVFPKRKCPRGSIKPFQIVLKNKYSIPRYFKFLIIKRKIKQYLSQFTNLDTIDIALIDYIWGKFTDKFKTEEGESK